jgi:hypothetical protein
LAKFWESLRTTILYHLFDADPALVSYGRYGLTKKVKLPKAHCYDRGLHNLFLQIWVAWVVTDSYFYFLKHVTTLAPNRF